MFVKPKPGVRVRDPKNRGHLPESGADVPEDQYWLRRLADGDVTLSSPIVQIPDSDNLPEAKEKSP